jgi:hypothetical protein
MSILPTIDSGKGDSEVSGKLLLGQAQGLPQV